MSEISHFHGRLRDRKSGTRWMGRGLDAGETTLGNVRRLSLDDHFGDGVGRGGTGTSTTSRPFARRVAFGLGIPHLWNASLRLSLATPGLAKPTRKPTAAPRVVVGTDRVECQASHSLDMGQRAQRQSGAGPRRHFGVSGRSHSLGEPEGRCLMPATTSHCHRRRNSNGFNC